MITPGICQSFLLELASGIHDFTADEFKIALFEEGATLTPETTAYATTNECSGSGYTAGGVALVAEAGYPQIVSGKCLMDWEDPSWNPVTVNARAALIYNADKANRAVMVIDFGITMSPVAQAFTVLMPMPDASRAVLRIMGGAS